MRTLTRWLKIKWQGKTEDLVRAYAAVFNSHDGQVVLQHLLDEVYYTIYEGTNANEAIAHNARRAVIDEILRNIDMGEFPQKYDTPEEDPNDNLRRIRNHD